mmetsp:Transcript_9825/g.15606  ORF Transcript_9825/g.15606 Transcript_9825/m.15606 type:complete len:470 (-) Transcript_9825:193-1602(-)
METPVQTWGALGGMVSEQNDFGAKTAQYMENNEVYDLFSQLLKQVLVERPENPLKFLQDQLMVPPKFCVCVMGPPGINRSKYCQQIATDYQVKHIHVGKLLRAKKELKENLEAGDLVADNIVIDLVKAELLRNKGSGWVLDGFPRTKVQARALAAAGKELACSVDSLLLLHAPEDVIRERYAAKVAAAGFKMEDKQYLIDTRLQQYHRHVLGLAEIYQNTIRTIEVSGGDDDQNVTYSSIKTCLHHRAYSNAPLRMHRICILGPCGSGRSTQSEFIAKNFGVVHVDVADLLRKHQEASGQVCEEVPPEFLGDEEICSLVGARLRQTDCVRKGWVLDGFPKTKAQAQFLRQAHHWPSRVIRLQTTVEQVGQRINLRRLDPVTGISYYQSPDSVVIRQRLVTRDYDSAEKVKERFHLYVGHVERAMECWPSVSSSIQGDGDPEDVAKGISDKITMPTPIELAQDPNSGLQG